MTGKEFKSINEAISIEGFDYCFSGYSDFPEIRDEEFHKLRKNYLESKKLLIDFLGFED